MKPYVVVVADPGFVASTTEQEASFRTYVIGIVTHGALINPSWKHGPPWQLQTAKILKEQGYDAVIAYNWASQSSTPGKAATQGPRLAREILATASRFPANAPVDLHFIGHSEGAVVNTQAIVALDKVATPQLKAGYIEDTLLDPHAANNSVPAQGSEGSGILESLANDLIRAYQAKANDPPVFIPPGVDSTQVFYQHTSARHDHGTNLGVYNLWGQVPVPNLSGAPVSYFNLTAAGAVHSGKYGVALWYRNFVAPSLGNQAPWIQSLQLEGQINQAVAQPDIGVGALASRRTQAWGPVRTAPGPRIVFAGTAAPESKVRVYIGPAAKSSVITLAGQTTASSNGTWTLTSRPLLDGYDRAIAMAYRRVRGARPGLAVVPVAPLGRFKVTTDLPMLEHLDHGAESKTLFQNPRQWLFV